METTDLHRERAARLGNYADAPENMPAGVGYLRAVEGLVVRRVGGVDYPLFEGEDKNGLEIVAGPSAPWLLVPGIGLYAESADQTIDMTLETAAALAYSILVQIDEIKAR